MASSDAAPSDLQLMTTLVYRPRRSSPDESIALLHRHVKRLNEARAAYRSAGVITWADSSTKELDEEELVQFLVDQTEGREAEKSWRVTVLLAANGALSARILPHAPSDHLHPVRLALDTQPTDYSPLEMRYKTSYRSAYDAARLRVGATLRASPEDVFDVVMWNQDGDVTESSIANLAFCFSHPPEDGSLSIDDKEEWVTPPRSSGALEGTQRAEMLETGQIVERPVRLDELRKAAQDGRVRIKLFNAVRGVMEALVII